MLALQCMHANLLKRHSFCWALHTMWYGNKYLSIYLALKCDRRTDNPETMSHRSYRVGHKNPKYEEQTYSWGEGLRYGGALPLGNNIFSWHIPLHKKHMFKKITICLRWEPSITILDPSCFPPILLTKSIYIQNILDKCMDHSGITMTKPQYSYPSTFVQW